MAFVDGYEKVSAGGMPPYSSAGTEKTNEASAPAKPAWAKRPTKGGESESK